MNSLHEFYTSRKWSDFLNVLKQERTDDNGNIICQFCGKPILKKYDVIGHHKIHLTEDNVNDTSISLNPNNIIFVHHVCHNHIHNKLETGVRRVYIVYGPPLSGKSTFVKKNMIKGDLIVDLDLIWKCISNQEMYVKPESLKPLVFKIRDLLIEGIKYRLGRWKNAYIIGCYPYSSERERLSKELGAELILIDATLDECLERLNNDDSGRDKDIWSKEIENWFENN